MSNFESKVAAHPVTPIIGAEITGIDFNNLQEGDLDAIYDLLIKHHVIFFRDQDISPEAHLSLARSFGEPEPPHPVYPKMEGYENITVLNSGGGIVPDTDDWHKDMTFKPNPAFTTILHAVEVPDVGGDTLWANMTAAYNALPAGMKTMLEGLEAIHDVGTFRNNYYEKGGIEAVNNALKETGSAVHKVIETHPVTGEKYINVNQSFTRHIMGYKYTESDRLLQYLYLHINKPEYQVRFRWRKNSVAIWDNRNTQHYAVCDYLPKVRKMQRVTVLNDRRVGA